MGHVAPEAHDASVTFKAMTPGVRITKGTHRPWVEKWVFMMHHLKRLDEFYDTNVAGSGNLDVEAWATGFFVECDHLVDWLCGDVTALSGVTETDIVNYAKASAALRHADEISNTHKHYRRRPYKKGMAPEPTARIGTTDRSSTGRWTVTIELDWLTRTTGPTIDARVLARECVEQWRAFFNAHTITEPA